MNKKQTDILHEKDTIIISFSISSSTQPYRYNKASVLSVLAQKWTGVDPDSSQMVMLEDIANQCPLQGGKGVYMARGILSEYSLEKVVYDDLAKCDTLIPRTTKHSASSFHIYPNPANEAFTVESDSPLLSVSVVDMRGGLMYQTKEINDKRARITTQNWPAGVYIIHVQIKDGQDFESKKLIVVP